MSVRTATGGTIRRRVARALALPVAAVLVLLAVIAVMEGDEYRRAAASARAVTLVLAVQDLAQELQNERGLAAGLLGGNAGFRAELAPARQRVDVERERLEQLAGAVRGGPGARVTAALRGLDGLSGVRVGTDSGATGRQLAFAYYTERIDELARLDLGLDSATDPALRRGTAALEALGDAKESMAQERAFLNGVFSAGGFGEGEFLQFVTMRSTKAAALATFDRFAGATQRTAADYVFDTGAGRVAGYFEEVALGAGDGRSLVVNPQSWWSSLTTVLDDLLRLEQHVGSVIRVRAAELRDQATRRMGVLGVVVLLCFGGSVYLALIESRSIARPLAVLAADADRLALDLLPEAVRRAGAGEQDAALPPVHAPPGASDEVRSMATALDRVQATAYALATEQAQLRRGTTESLADLGRRNQNLVRRQLGFITRLEREEPDPAGLANLFELDHLATRMRRNAESLLVLAGAATPRQWSEPLPVSDVIRAAVAEVEEYRRVTLRRVDDTMLAGAVAGGIAHLLAELVENGLTFSPPDVDVEIQGRLIGDRYLIVIVDQGIGMSAEDLGEANRRLRGEGDFLVAPARFLGHYVVGRLARDLGAEVQLTPSSVTGTTARVFLPAAVLARPRQVAPPRFAPRPVSAEPSVGPQLASPQHAVSAESPLSPQHAVSSDSPVSPQHAVSLDSSVTPQHAVSLDSPVGPQHADLESPVSPQHAVSLEETVILPLAVPGPAGVSVTPAGGRLRPTTVEYVLAPQTPVLPLQRTHAEPMPAASVPGGARTANGLPRRPPRQRRETAAPPAPPARPTAGRPAEVDSTPDEVRARLTALRSGLLRGGDRS